MNLRIRPRPSTPRDPAPQMRAGYYRDPAVLNGGPAVSPLTWVFVLLAGVADLAAFYSVVAVLFRAQQTIVWLATVGFTAVGVGLAHQIGVGFKQRRCADPRSSALLWGSVAAWLGLGTAAFVVRWLNAPLSTALGAGSSFSPVGDAPASAVGRPLLAAIFFAVLYVASGLLAAFAGFHDHNPDATALERARDMRRVAAARREASLTALTQLRAVRAALAVELEAADEHREAMRRTTEASVYELKNRARLLLAVDRDAAEAQDILDEAPQPPRAWSRPPTPDQP